jgi:adenine phosphoribosyltransferase
MLELLKDSLAKCPVVKKGDYNYFVHPITDGIPDISPELLEEVTDEFVRIGDMNCDKIAVAEAMAIPLGAALSLRIRKPFVVIRKKNYGLPDEVSVEQITGYSKSSLFINGLKKGDKVLIVDDVLSTGGTLHAIVKALRQIGVEIVDIVIVFNKHEDKSIMEKKVGMPIKTFLDVDVVNGKAVVV